MTRFTPDCLAQARKITETLYNTPGCALFRNPVDPIADKVPDYHRIVKNPQDLGTIKHRLMTDYYTTLEDWMTDMNLIWANAEKYNGKEALVTYLAQAMAKKFGKMIQRMHPSNGKKWIDRISVLYQRLDEQMQAAPPELEQYFKGKQFVGTLSQQDMQKFCEAASALSNRTDVFQMIQLLTLFGVHLDIRREECFIPVKSLPASAIRALISFVKAKCKAGKMDTG